MSNLKSNRSLRERLRGDVVRYLLDYQLSSPYKLILVIDFWPIFLLRLEDHCACSGYFVKRFLNIFVILLRPVIQGVAGTRIFRGAQIGSSLLIHTSVGVVITPKAIIGEHCTIFSGAGVAHRADGKGAGAPVIGDNVKLMSGCKVIGPVVIGNNVIVGANAVVLQDVPDNSIAVGIPAIVKELTV